MLKVGVVIEGAEVKNVCQLNNSTAQEISMAIANLELGKSILVSKLIEITNVNPSNTPLVKKEVGKATADPTQKKRKEFKKPDDIKSCSQKQYNILKQADFDDQAIKLMSQDEIRKSIGYYLDSLKEENI